MSCDHPNDVDMEGYVMARLDGERWSIRHNGCPGPGVVRSGLNDALYWITVHEDVHAAVDRLDRP